MGKSSDSVCPGKYARCLQHRPLGNRNMHFCCNSNGLNFLIKIFHYIKLNCELFLKGIHKHLNCVHANLVVLERNGEF